MMMKQLLLISGLLSCICLTAWGQKGGESTYSFLGLTNAARVAALGGENVSLADEDINLVYHNPALLDSALHRHMNLNYVNYFAGVNFGYASYAIYREGLGSFAAGIHYVNYGSFDGTDELGQFQGNFRASEYALNLVYARALLDPNLILGVNLKPIYSSFERYNSFGIALDLGLSYYFEKSLTSLGLVLKNMGTQISSYTGDREKIPFEIQAGVTQGLAHAPFRFHITLQHLERWDLSYEIDEEDSGFTGIEEVQRSGFDVFGDQLMRHVIFGTEFLLGENFHVDLGYNYKRRKEMKVSAKAGMVGFSVGFGFRISKFHIAFGRAAYHLAGGTNHFSLTTNLSDFFIKE